MKNFFENTPNLWKTAFPVKVSAGHKYDSGHAVIYGAPELTGATRLAASACARMGAGLVSVLSCAERADIYRASLPAHILVRDNVHWSSSNVTSRLYGSGGVVDGVEIQTELPCVIDADGLGIMPEDLNDSCVLTPHEGEFKKIWPDLAGGREDRALAAAQKTGAVVVLKGQATVIAHPDGRCAVNSHDSLYLATAGTGDVLTGMVCGLLAQGMPAFDAACAAVWMHGDAGRKIGAGLVAEDIPDFLPQILKEILGKR